MIIVSFLILIVYFFFLGCLVVGWKNIFTKKETPSSRQLFITVLVPVRNEEKNIGYLLSDLLKQDYGIFEIIVIEDHSEDKTAVVIRSLNSPQVQCIVNKGSGKKQALTTGVSVSHGDII